MMTLRHCILGGMVACGVAASAAAEQAVSISTLSPLPTLDGVPRPTAPAHVAAPAAAGAQIQTAAPRSDAPIDPSPEPQRRQVGAAPAVTAAPVAAPVILASWDAPMPPARRAWVAPATALRPVARPILIPDARWDHRPNGRAWTRAGIAAMRSHGGRITDVVPRDIDQWCPGYVDGNVAERRAFWIGFLSALSFHESTWRPDAVGGGGLWFGLLQILPQTARHFKCNATTGPELKDGAANVSCAVRILNHTIPRDRAIALKERRWMGVAADWGPMRNAERVAQMQRWTRAQPYCRVQIAPRVALRPVARPIAVIADMSAEAQSN